MDGVSANTFFHFRYKNTEIQRRMDVGNSRFVNCSYDRSLRLLNNVLIFSPYSSHTPLLLGLHCQQYGDVTEEKKGKKKNNHLKGLINLMNKNNAGIVKSQYLIMSIVVESSENQSNH